MITLTPEGRQGIATVTSEGGCVVKLVRPTVPTVPIVPTAPTVPVGAAVPEPILPDPVPFVEVYGAVTERPGTKGIFVAEGIIVAIEVGRVAGCRVEREDAMVPLPVPIILVKFEAPVVWAIVML